PENPELKKILEKETFYPISEGKKNIHYPEFKTIIELLNYLKLPTDLFLKEVPDVYAAVSEGKVLLNKIVAKTIGKSDLKLIEILNKLYDYLSEEDALEKCDTVFVFGAKTPFRAIKGAEVFQKVNAERIIVSGGTPIYGNKSQKPEAIIYKEILVESGISESKIIAESKSITLPDNVWCTLHLLDDLKIKPRCIAIINSPYSQRRGWTFFKKYLTDSVKLIRVNSDTAITRDNWYEKKDTLCVVLNEFMKMRASVVYNTA
ncbi:MAG: YdcF family protein, partial [Candidatus Daviesbacteria bacterium]|nr:YdcF family protein [Candidatus Daviesbacteria bacterium]